MNHNVQAFRITQSTTQTFRDLYMHKTLLVLIAAGSKQLHPKTERSLIAQAGQLLVFPSGTFITLENRALSGSDYQADCICYPDDMVAEVFSQQRASIKIPSAIHIEHCPTGFASIVKGLGQIVSDSELPDEIKHHHLLEPLLWLKSMGGLNSLQCQKNPSTANYVILLQVMFLKNGDLMKWLVSLDLVKPRCAES